MEDATLSKWVIEKFKREEILIVTSDYHQHRAKIIFSAVYAPFKNLSFFSASSEFVDPEILNSLVAHEKLAVEDLLKYGVRF
ncbi:YdcF family protein [Dyadobacter sp. CY345]|uniref:ElyC/SanA/YdcF family protein n=1 Tax=Dyadobacter sp. CY345 TaxID=2909335 RepID=UPI001F28D579|nr:ElyC/SanA/YdcF family protein [Dyadobacter sp. CY345]MCF2443741.1 YdcF family protein [Dyadobacter sp. CY345]